MIPPDAAARIAERRQGVRRNPRDANANALLGLALLKELQLEEGVKALQRALELNAKLRGVHGVLAGALFDLRRYEEAVACYRVALRFQEAADLHQHLADALLRLGRADEAEPSARRAAELAPQDIAIQLTLAGVMNARGAAAEVDEIMARVLALAPDEPGARFDLACLLYQGNRLIEARTCLEGVLAAQPQHVRALHQLALCHKQLDNGDEAIRTLEQAVTLAPGDDSLLDELRAVLQKFRRYPDAIGVARQLLERNPESGNALNTLLHCHFTIGEWEHALQAARRLLEVSPSAVHHSILLFILSHCCTDAEALTREHLAFGERWEPGLQALRRPHTNDRDPARVLRVGLVSADLYNHAVSNFLAPTLSALKNSTQLQIYAYYNNAREDAITHAIKNDVHAWRVIWNMDDATAEDLIRKDGIDILIDLSGHSAMNRLPLFARKPAPVQATWMGYAGTTGLASMDYILQDRFMVPGTRYDKQFTEKIVKLPLGAPFLPSSDAPPVNPLPALSNGYLTFGSFHRASKLSPSVIALWASLLRAVPTSKMLLGGLVAGNDELLTEWFAREGIPRERLLMRQRSGIRAYLAQHHEVDICLSPFPYSGSTTIGHALWMGVPTLGTVGKTNPSQAAAPYMTHLGLHTFVTDSPETYVKLGQLLAENLSALATIRSTMRERFLNSILGYPGIVGGGVELALRRMWERWCRGMDAAPIEITMQDLADTGASAAAGQDGMA
ncbi:tetratricopeptide repeat protein [Massilia sp. UYP11]|uniref:O-linked N-acetylglucosamine transferase family protein n=1 Tax=Massilia sp. UYP11 TaxID=1756385 RepID=UPI003D1C89AB